MKLILHIGMQRTGTTFLQHDVFPNIHELNLVDFDRHNAEVTGNAEIKNILCNIEKYEYETISKKVFGSKKHADRVVIIDKEKDKIEPGDKIILKDKYFLETGQVKRRTRRDLFQVDNVK